MKHRCPDEETLAAYFDGLLPAEEEALLHEEMVGCPDCARLTGALGLVLRAAAPDAWSSAPSVPAGVTRAAVELWPEPAPTAADPLAAGLRIAVRWLGERLAPLADALAPLPTAAVAVRGSAASEADDLSVDDLSYEVTVGALPLGVDLEVDGPRQIALTVRPLRTPPSGALLRLTRGGTTRALSTLSAAGTTLPALEPGAYELTLEQGNRRLGSVALDLGDAEADA